MEKIRVKSVLNKHKKRDSWFLEDYTLNPYLGCSMNCLYCYVQGSKYGERVGPHLAIKVNAPEILYRQLKNQARKRAYGVIALGSATDPYIKQEKDLGITRELLKIIYRFKFPLEIMTKSTLIERDIDILKKIDEKAILPSDLARTFGRGLIIAFSFSAMDPQVAKIFEPGAPPPEERLRTMKLLVDEGFRVGACLMPLLPFISDSKVQMDHMIRRVKEYGGDFILVSGLTLFGNKPTDCRIRYFNALKKHFPDVLLKTENMYHDTSFPSWRYQKRLSEIAGELCSKYNIKNRIC